MVNDEPTPRAGRDRRALTAIATASLLASLLVVMPAGARMPVPSASVAATADLEETDPASTPDADVEPAPDGPASDAPVVDEPEPVEPPEPGASPEPEASAEPEAPVESEPVPDTLSLTGLLQVVVDEPEGALGGGGDHGSGVTVTLVTADASIPIAGDVLDGAVSGTTFQGTVAVPEAVIERVEQAPERMPEQAPDGAPPVARHVIEVAEQIDETFEVVAATLTPPVAAAVAAKAHTLDVIYLAPAGYDFPSESAVNGLTARLNEYWPSQTNGQISGVSRTSAYRTARVSKDVACHAEAAWDYAAGPAGFNRKGEWDSMPPRSYYWGGSRSAHLVVLVPETLCGYGGLGSLGEVHTGGTVWGTVTSTLPEWDGVVFHEFGHNLGLGHANARSCTELVSDGPSCMDEEYRDYFDVMGGGYSYGSLNNRRDMPALSVTQRAQLDALPRGGALGEVRVDKGVTQTFTLKPISDTSGLRGLEILDPLTQERLYVEYRSGTGRDATAFYARWASDPSVRDPDWLRPGVRVLKLRGCTTPSKECTGSVVLPRPVASDPDDGFSHNAPLSFLAGHEFAAASSAGGYTGVRVRVLSTSATQAVVEVAFDARAAKFGTVPKVTIEGTPSYYGVLTAKLSTAWSPAPDTTTLQWLRNGVPIAGATSTTYRVTDADRGKKLTVRAAAYKNGYARSVVISAAVTVSTDVPTDGSLSGMVGLPSGVPAAWREGMQVHAVGVGNGANAGEKRTVAVNAQTGAYSFTGLIPGEWRVQAAPGMTTDAEGTPVPVDLAALWYPAAAAFEAATSVQVVGAVKGIDITLTRGRTISGTVTLPAGAPRVWLDEVVVRASGGWMTQGAQPRDSWARVDRATGAYTIRGLDPGSYYVQFEVQPRTDADLSSQWYDGAHSSRDMATVSTQAGNATKVDAALQRSRTISGRVTLPTGVSSDWLREVSVTVSDAFGSSHPAEMATDGTYVVRGLTPGAYTVCASVSDRWDYESDASVHSGLLPRCWGGAFSSYVAASIDVSKSDRSGADIALIRAGTVSGKISLPTGIDKKSMAAVQLVATPVDTNGVRLTWANDAFASPDLSTGAYTLEGLLPTRYLIRLEASSHVYDEATGEQKPTNLTGLWYKNARTPSAATLLDLTTDRNRTGIDMSPLKAVSTISGTVEVTPPSGQSFWGATLTLLDRTGQTAVSSVTLDSEGTGAFSFSGLPGGDYRLLLEATYYDPSASSSASGGVRKPTQYLAVAGSKLLTVADGGSRTGLQLKPATATATIGGFLTTAGLPDDIGAVGEVVLYERMGSEWVRYPTAVTSTDKNEALAYTTPQLAVASYTVGFQATENLRWQSDVDVVESWWNAKKTLATADAIALTAGQKRTGVHGVVHKRGVVPPPPGGETTDPGEPVDPGGPGSRASFLDVSGTPGAWNYSAFDAEITWMATQGISTGYDVVGGKEYRPFAAVSRDAMAAFLYRFAGSPAFTAPATSPFTDVKTTQPFYKEIAWLASTGVSTGWDVGGGRKEFRPFQPIARDAMAAFLYRFAKVPSFTPPPRSAFTDVTTTQPFYKEIAWLASTGVSTGWDVGGGRKEFRPYQPISRDAMAAFLFRFSRLPR